MKESQSVFLTIAPFTAMAVPEPANPSSSFRDDNVFALDDISLPFTVIFIEQNLIATGKEGSERCDRNYNSCVSINCFRFEGMISAFGHPFALPVLKNKPKPCGFGCKGNKNMSCFYIFSILSIGRIAFFLISSGTFTSPHSFSRQYSRLSRVIFFIWLHIVPGATGMNFLEGLSDFNL